MSEAPDAFDPKFNSFAANIRHDADGIAARLGRSEHDTQEVLARLYKTTKDSGDVSTKMIEDEYGRLDEVGEK